MNRLQLSNQLQNQCNNIEIAFAGADMILIVHFHVWPEIRPLGFKGLISGAKLNRKRGLPNDCTKEDKRQRAKSTPKLFQSFSSFGKVSQELFKKKIMAVFIANMLPLHIIESKSFQDFVSSCILGKKSMSRRTLTLLIEDENGAKKKFLQNTLSSVLSWLLQLINVPVETDLILV